MERPLAERIGTARQLRQTQLALDLARALVRQQPTDPHRELLRQVTLERARDLEAHDKAKDAATVYATLIDMGGPPEFQALVAERLASCGVLSPALSLTDGSDDPAARQKIFMQAIDSALMQGPTGKNGLTPDLYAGFDAVQQAFTLAEAGRDEAARAALQGIGLQSPFLEWKLFLRGLLAYYGKEDARAQENWQRLDSQRLPARLASTLRASIDVAFLKAQPAAVQKALQTRIAQLHGGNIIASLRDLQKPLVKDDLAPAFRKAETLVPLMKREHPLLMRRLEQCFFWAIIDHGEPSDIQRHIRLFGRPNDDPTHARLQALALESHGYWEDAHSAWKELIGHIEKSSDVWPGEIGKRAQAIVWAHMAENASPLRNRRRRRGSGNPFFDLFNDVPGPLKPDAEQCFAKAIKLAPDRLESYVALFDLHREDKKTAKAIKTGQQLLKQFPDHADTLEAMGELSLESKDYKQAQDFFERSLRANPLDRTLRGKLARARQNFGLVLTVAKKYAEARAQYEQSLQLWDGPKTPLLCQWAVAEWKAGEAVRAEELIAQAQAEPNQRLACRYALVGESVRAKLPADVKKRFAADLKSALAAAPTPAEILVLLESAALQRQTHSDAFHGQKTQEKSILKFLDNLSWSDFDEGQLERLCAGLMTLQARKPWLKCLTYARRTHRQNVPIRLSFIDYYLTERRAEDKTHLAEEHLDTARQLIEAMPRGEQQQQFLEQLKEKEEVLAKLHSNRPAMFDMLDRIFGGFGGMGDDDFDDDDDDDFF